MTDKYIYGKKEHEVTSAAGVKGVLCRAFGGGYFFRVYNDDHSFIDYKIAHDDLSVTIAADELASFYVDGEHAVLDHSPNVLGLKKIDSDK